MLSEVERLTASVFGKAASVSVDKVDGEERARGIAIQDSNMLGRDVEVKGKVVDPPWPPGLVLVEHDHGCRSWCRADSIKRKVTGGGWVVRCWDAKGIEVLSSGKPKPKAKAIASARRKLQQRQFLRL